MMCRANNSVNRGLVVAALVSGLVTAMSAIAQAPGETHWRDLHDSAIVIDEHGLVTDQVLVPGVTRVLVRMVDSQGNTVVDAWNEGGLVDVDTSSLPDGLYHWEVLSVVEAVAEGAERRTLRSNGILQVEGGVVIIDESDADGIDATVFEGALRHRPGPLARMVGHVLDWLVSSAQASQQVTDYVRVSGNYSQVIFKDTSEDDTPFTSDWSIYADDFEFMIRDSTGFDAIYLARDEAENALVVDGNGDMTLQNGMYFLDQDQPRIGLNRTPTALGGNLQIEDLAPRISLWDPDSPGGPQQMFLNFDDGQFGIWSTDMQSIFDVVNLDMTAPGDSLKLFADGTLGFAEFAYVSRTEGALGVGRLPVAMGGQVQVESDAPWLSLHKTGEGLAQMNFDGEYVNFGQAVSVRGQIGFLNRVRFSMGASGSALVLDTDGNLGVGGNSGGASLEVRRNDGSARIHVNETETTAAPRTLFQLSNAGNTKFEIEETASGNSWAFTNSGEDFRISLQDSGTVEFRVDNAGDAFLAGALTENSDVNAKQAIRPVDVADVLARVASLPVSRWQYKDAPGVDHLGPMAQDFHTAFGLGASETGISTIDTAGVALAAIQALANENSELKSRLARLEQQTQALVHLVSKQHEDAGIRTAAVGN